MFTPKCIQSGPCKPSPVVGGAPVYPTFCGGHVQKTRTVGADWRERRVTAWAVCEGCRNEQLNQAPENNYRVTEPDGTSKIVRHYTYTDGACPECNSALWRDYWRDYCGPRDTFRVGHTLHCPTSQLTGECNYKQEPTVDSDDTDVHPWIYA